MTRRFRRSERFEVALQITTEGFIRPPRDAQRNWILNRALNEFVEDLEHLDDLSKSFIAGTRSNGLEDRTQAVLSDEEIMEDWQIPIIEAMADFATERHGSVLEIGFGRGLASTAIQDAGVERHTIIECNESIIDRFQVWKKSYPTRDIRIVKGKWQDVIDDLDVFDGILFHTYPLNEEEFLDTVVQSSTFAEHFFPHAAAHLVDGGIFTYFSNEIDSFSRGHQRSLFRHFSTVTLKLVAPLNLPADTRDDFWADSMVVPKAIK